MLIVSLKSGICGYLRVFSVLFPSLRNAWAAVLKFLSSCCCAVATVNRFLLLLFGSFLLPSSS